MERNLKASETVRVSDSGPRGVVVLEREDGTLVFRKENMIVATGRQYISNLVYGMIESPAETRFIETIKFGTGGAAIPEADQEDLEANVAAYDLTLDTSLVWKKSPATVEEGDHTTVPAELGQYLFNRSNDKLYIGTTGPVWTEATNYTFGESIPTTGTENHLFYHKDMRRLYVRSKAFTVEPLTSPLIGMLFSCTIRGIASSFANINELGLFLNDGDPATMFSRLAFDAVPLTMDTDAYNLSYYIYF